MSDLLKAGPPPVPPTVQRRTGGGVAPSKVPAARHSGASHGHLQVPCHMRPAIASRSSMRILFNVNRCYLINEHNKKPLHFLLPNILFYLLDEDSYGKGLTLGMSLSGPVTQKMIPLLQRSWKGFCKQSKVGKTKKLNTAIQHLNDKSTFAELRGVVHRIVCVYIRTLPIARVLSSPKKTLNPADYIEVYLRATGIGEDELSEGVNHNFELALIQLTKDRLQAMTPITPKTQKALPEKTWAGIGERIRSGYAEFAQQIIQKKEAAEMGLWDLVTILLDQLDNRPSITIPSESLDLYRQFFLVRSQQLHTKVSQFEQLALREKCRPQLPGTQIVIEIHLDDVESAFSGNSSKMYEFDILLRVLAALYYFQAMQTAQGEPPPSYANFLNPSKVLYTIASVGKVKLADYFPGMDLRQGFPADISVSKLFFLVKFFVYATYTETLSWRGKKEKAQEAARLERDVRQAAKLLEQKEEESRKIERLKKAAALADKKAKEKKAAALALKDAQRLKEAKRLEVKRFNEEMEAAFAQLRRKTAETEATIATLLDLPRAHKESMHDSNFVAKDFDDLRSGLSAALATEFDPGLAQLNQRHFEKVPFQTPTKAQFKAIEPRLCENIQSTLLALGRRDVLNQGVLPNLLRHISGGAQAYGTEHGIIYENGVLSIKGVEGSVGERYRIDTQTGDLFILGLTPS